MMADKPLTKLTPDISEMSPKNVDQDLEQLGQLIDKSPERAALLEDVRLSLLARKYENQGQRKAAKENWQHALVLAQGKVGRIAFSGYVRNSLELLEKKIDADVFAKLLLAEFQGGQSYSYLVENRLENEENLTKYLRDNFAQYLSPPERPEVVQELSDDQDPIFVERAKVVCKNPTEPKLLMWRDKLQMGLRNYFNALVQQCQDHSQAAIELFTKAKSELSSMSFDILPLQLEATSRLIALRRANGERETVAPLYLDLMRFYDNKRITPKSMGLSDMKFWLRKVEDTLWAARYRAIQGDLENSKIFAQKTLNLVEDSLLRVDSATADFRDKMLIFRTEAQHFLAFRIAVDQKDYLRASALNTIALQGSSLPDEWRNRLGWYAGFYEYLAGNLETARMRWETLLAETTDDSYRPMIYFWLAKTLAASKKSDESRFYIRSLIEQYPFSFYAVVATPLSGFKVDEEDWLADLLNTDGARKFDFDFATDVGDENLRKLLKRADALASVGLVEWADYSLSEVDSYLARKKPEESDTKTSVFASRLHYRIGNYLQMIGATTQLAKKPGFWKKYPDQPGYYFPLAYDLAYREAGSRTGVDPAILQAISRQESGFNATLKSSANAIGLMQVLPSTAKKWMPEASNSSESAIAERLKEPLVNISAGAHHYRSLMGKYQDYYPATFGAYNAGDSIMDGWIAHRQNTDPMVFVELIPYNETRSYVKNVWRNLAVYRTLKTSK